MKIKHLKLHLFALLIICCLIAPLLTKTGLAKVIDSDPITDQRWIISEIYLGDNDYKGAYVELYNNDDHNALGWQDFVINLPFDFDMPPIGDFHSYKPHAYKKLSLGEGWVGWLAKKYIKTMYGDSIFQEIEDALDEQDGYSYQRCQSDYGDRKRLLSNKFYYGKKTPGKAIKCSDSSVTATDPNDLPKAGQCTKLHLNEIGANLSDNQQFVEFVNAGDETINLSNCHLAISKVKDSVHHKLPDHDLDPGGLYSLNISEHQIPPLSKASGVIYLIDSDDTTVVSYKRYSNTKPGTSLALDENGIWKTTFRPTPGEDNVIEENKACPTGQVRDQKTGKCRKPDPKPGNDQSLKPCPEGYERNPETHRCRKMQSDDDDLPDCPDGYERNPETNRCRKITTGEDEEDDSGGSALLPCRAGYVRNPVTNRCVKVASSSTSSTSSLTPCKEGYKRNPVTNRCVKIADTNSADAKKKLTPCKDGYERNPETNRCVKKKAVSGGTNSTKTDNAKYPVKTSTDQAKSTSTTTLIIALIATTAVALGILAWQYRQEIKQAYDKLRHRGTK